MLPPQQESSQSIHKCRDGPQAWREAALASLGSRPSTNRKRAQVVFLTGFPKLSCRGEQSSFLTVTSTEALNNARSSLPLRPAPQRAPFPNFGKTNRPTQTNLGIIQLERPPKHPNTPSQWKISRGEIKPVSLLEKETTVKILRGPN